MNQDVVAQIRRACSQLAAGYDDLFDPDATSGGQTHREHASRNRNDPPAPTRVEVWDLIRQINQLVLDLHRTCALALGHQPAPPVDVGYRQSSLVPVALAFLYRSAGQLQQAGLADHVLAVLAGDGEVEGLVRATRRLLGLTARSVVLEDCACPLAVGPQGTCGGVLVAIPSRGLVVCRRCSERWAEGEWEHLGRIVRDTEEARAA
jgi:hypothetical protein